MLVEIETSTTSQCKRKKINVYTWFSFSLCRSLEVWILVVLILTMTMETVMGWNFHRLLSLKCISHSIMKVENPSPPKVSSQPSFFSLFFFLPGFLKEKAKITIKSIPSYLHTYSLPSIYKPTKRRELREDSLFEI